MSAEPTVRLAAALASDAAPVVGPPAPEAAGRTARTAAVVTGPVEVLLLDTKQAAGACGLSRSAWFRARAAGKTPAPVRILGKVLYRLADLKLWVALGCPPR